MREEQKMFLKFYLARTENHIGQTKQLDARYSALISAAAARLLHSFLHIPYLHGGTYVRTLAWSLMVCFFAKELPLSL